MGNKIKLFVDAHVFDGIPQGSVTYIAGLYSELVKDPRFELFVGSNNRTIVENFLDSDNFIHINYKSGSRLKRLFFTIPRALRENNIDFAHFQYISPFQKPCKYIVTIHDLLFLEYSQYFPYSYRIKNTILFYLTAKRADLIATVSGHSKEIIHRLFNISSENIFITSNAVRQNSDKPEPVKQLQNSIFLLNVSRIEPRKNQTLLIQSWKELGLADRDIHLVLVGSEGIKDKMFCKQISGLSDKEQKRFHWLSEVPDSQLKWLYQNTALFIYTSAAEGFGIPPLEAAINGAKVLCSNSTSMADFVFFKEFLFPPIDKELIKQKIHWAMSAVFPHQTVKSEIASRYNWQNISQLFASEIIKNLNGK